MDAVNFWGQDQAAWITKQTSTQWKWRESSRDAQNQTEFKSCSFAPGHKIKQNWWCLGSNSLSKHSSWVPLVLLKKSIFNIYIPPRNKSKHLTLENLWYTFQEQCVKCFSNPCLHCGFQSFSRWWIPIRYGLKFPSTHRCHAYSGIC